MFGNQPNWKDEKTWNYEVGAKMQLLDQRVTFNLAVFYADINDLQATITAGTCSSRVVFNVPKARSQGIEAELFARPNANWDFGVSATYAMQAHLQSSVTDASGARGRRPADGNRLPTAPKLQGVANVGYTLPAALWGQWDFFGNLTGQYMGSSLPLVRRRSRRDSARSARARSSTSAIPTISGFNFDQGAAAPITSSTCGWASGTRGSSSRRS